MCLVFQGAWRWRDVFDVRSYLDGVHREQGAGGVVEEGAPGSELSTRTQGEGLVPLGHNTKGFGLLLPLLLAVLPAAPPENPVLPRLCSPGRLSFLTYANVPSCQSHVKCCCWAGESKGCDFPSAFWESRCLHVADLS